MVVWANELQQLAGSRAQPSWSCADRSCCCSCAACRGCRLDEVSEACCQANTQLQQQRTPPLLQARTMPAQLVVQQTRTGTGDNQYSTKQSTPQCSSAGREGQNMLLAIVCTQFLSRRTDAGLVDANNTGLVGMPNSPVAFCLTRQQPHHQHAPS